MLDAEWTGHAQGKMFKYNVANCSLKVLSSHLRGGSWVVSFDWLLNSLHFSNIFNFF
jgi:hypothetical protein